MFGSIEHGRPNSPGSVNPEAAGLVGIDVPMPQP